MSPPRRLITDALATDHRALEALFEALRGIPSRDAASRVAVFTRLQALLQAHSRAEEEVVYRALRARVPDDEAPQAAYEEHHVADLLLQELASGCPGGARWSAKLRVLETLLDHHIKEEETGSFALIDEHFSALEQATMAEEFRALKHEPVEKLLAPLRRATPAFAGRASIGVQSAAGRYLRRGELRLRRALRTSQA
ncbi:hemerythrin domain-containing protein [Solimonas soli]|uniref:hemerythrin domain-containing protein n=1 Tax=Solimonas soli TaxID=413479 RepID=UPI0004B4C834|nr:hemerythrin domain-containing protein [Solimonas soli]